MGGLTPEEKADFALLMQANESGGFVIEVGSNKHQALNCAIENEWVRLVEIDHRNAKLQRVFRLTGLGHWRLSLLCVAWPPPPEAFFQNDSVGCVPRSRNAWHSASPY